MKICDVIEVPSSNIGKECCMYTEWLLYAGRDVQSGMAYTIAYIGGCCYSVIFTSIRQGKSELVLCSRVQVREVLRQRRIGKAQIRQSLDPFNDAGTLELDIQLELYIIVLYGFLVGSTIYVERCHHLCHRPTQPRSNACVTFILSLVSDHYFFFTIPLHHRLHTHTHTRARART